MGGWGWGGGVRMIHALPWGAGGGGVRSGGLGGCRGVSELG